MKKILFVCLMAALGLGTGSAAAKDAKKASTVTTVFKTDIDCEHCAKRIMDNIPFEKGVKDVKVDVPSKEVTVVYDASKNDAEGLVKGFAKIRVKAEACDAKCCQGTACKENCCQKAACKENCCKKGDCDKKCCGLPRGEDVVRRRIRTDGTFDRSARQQRKNRQQNAVGFFFLVPNHSPGMDSSGSAPSFAAEKKSLPTGPALPAASTATLRITYSPPHSTGDKTL